ncbi:UNVERIFIED_CONTAM: hypothetical protein K2H54_028625 [Gekko kuhli]
MYRGGEGRTKYSAPIKKIRMADEFIPFVKEIVQLCMLIRTLCIFYEDSYEDRLRRSGSRAASGEGKATRSGIGLGRRRSNDVDGRWSLLGRRTTTADAPRSTSWARRKESLPQQDRPAEYEGQPGETEIYRHQKDPARSSRRRISAGAW